MWKIDGFLTALRIFDPVIFLNASPSISALHLADWQNRQGHILE